MASMRGLAANVGSNPSRSTPNALERDGSALRARDIEEGQVPVGLMTDVEPSEHGSAGASDTNAASDKDVVICYPQLTPPPGDAVKGPGLGLHVPGVGLKGNKAAGAGPSQQHGLGRKKCVLLTLAALTLIVVGLGVGVGVGVGLARQRAAAATAAVGPAASIEKGSTASAGPGPTAVGASPAEGKHEPSPAGADPQAPQQAAAAGTGPTTKEVPPSRESTTTAEPEAQAEAPISPSPAATTSMPHVTSAAAQAKVLLAGKPRLKDPTGALRSWEAGTDFCQWAGITCSPPTGLVESIILSELGLGGNLPVEWSSLTSLRIMDLSLNQITGDLPPEWAGLESLESMQLNNNSLSGTLPPEWGQLKLSELSLQANRLTGPLPTEWAHIVEREGKLAELLTTPGYSNKTGFYLLLDLSYNQLTGTLPPEWGQLKRLREMQLSNNLLQGPLPAEWSALRAMARMDVAVNNLKGTVPPEWGLLFGDVLGEQFYTSVGLYDNPGLSGCLPAAWGDEEKPPGALLFNMKDSGGMDDVLSPETKAQALHNTSITGYCSSR